MRSQSPWLATQSTRFQPDLDVLKGGRPNYSANPDSLIAASQVVAIEFQTIAAANKYWQK